MLLLPCFALILAVTPAPENAETPASESASAPGLTKKEQRKVREKEERRFTFWAGPRAALRAGNGPVGGGGSGSFGLGVRAYRGLWISVEVAEGFYSGPAETLGQIRIGGHYEFWTDKVRPIIWLGIDHAHQQTWANTKREPFLTLFGSSDDIEHRTGVGLGVAVRIPIAPNANNLMKHFSIMPKVDFTYFIDKANAPFVVALGGMLSVTF